jgi:protein O-GlcNAc transferase
MAMDAAALQALFHQALEHQHAGRLIDAEAIYRRLLAELPGHPDLNLNLSNVLDRQGRSEEAVAAVQTAIAARPDYAEAFHNLGVILRRLNRVDQAIAAYRQALAIKPDYPDALINLGNILIDRGETDEVLSLLSRAAELAPSSVLVLSNLGGFLNELKRSEEAITVLNRAIAADPSFAGAHLNLGKALAKLDRHDDAIKSFARAIALQPELSNAHESLGLSLHNLGELDAAVAAYREAMRLEPDEPRIHSDLILTMQYHKDFDSEKILAEEKRWNTLYGQFAVARHENDRAPDRRLRIGYVSGDLWNHAVGRNLLPMFQAHDHQSFEVYFYSNSREQDSITQAVRACADHWRKIIHLDDTQVAEIIRADKVDILIDLSQHTGRNRLPLFAQKPAPVQIAFGGYPGGTGLSAMDYRISDPYLDPSGSDWKYVEKTLRLPDSFWLYLPADHEPVGELPALRNGFVTFGCLNSFCKINEPVLRLWGRVLQTSPTSRLILLGGEPSQRRKVDGIMSSMDIAPHRIEMIPRQFRKQYMLEYERIDVALDTFPYNGHISSLDALWMGVPVVTLVGERAVSRGGWSLLNNLGLAELAAWNEEKFVEIAVGLAGDLPRLTELRRTLRQRMLDSPLTDAKRFASNMENLYRQAWTERCAT